MSYKSPIEVITDEVILQMEDNIVKAAQKCGINVNKTELQKALMYDRKQYTQGFEDGRKYEQEERGHGRWVKIKSDDWANATEYRCSECGKYRLAVNPVDYNWNYCPNCGAKMDEVAEDG